MNGPGWKAGSEFRELGYLVALEKKLGELTESFGDVHFPLYR